MLEGKVVIIPDEEQIEDEVFERDVIDDEVHALKYQEFSDYYNLGYEFDENYSYVAPVTITSLGHFCYNVSYNISSILFYIPEVITKRQYNYFIKNKEEFMKYTIFCETLPVKEEKLYEEEIDNIDDLEREINKRYNLYKKKGGVLNAR